MEYFDDLGNEIKVGDEVLILVPKTYTTYRRGIIKDFRDAWTRENYFHCEVLVEYDDGRLYSNLKRWDQKDGKLSFSKKTTKAWRSNGDIVKLKPEYLS